MSNKPLFGRASHLGNMGSWKAGSPTSNPLLLKAESRQFFIASWLVLPYYMETWGRHRKIPQQIALETTNQKVYAQLDCDRHELLGSSKDSKCWVQNIYGEKSFESITDSQLMHQSWQCSSWIVTPDSINHPYQLSELLMSWMSLQRMVRMDSWNKTCRTRFFSAVRHV